MAIATINPATGETLKTYDELSEAEVERCLAAAAATHASYRLTSFADRAGWMRQAADILGLHYVDKMRFVVLPQAFRIIIPVALSQSISLFKDTSLVSTLGVADLMYQARVISTQTYRPLEILTVAALIYFVLAFPCTLATRVLELRLARARH